MARVNSYDGYIFDYGGVLAHHQTDADQAGMAAIAGIPQEKFSSLYWDTRLDYDKGSVTAAEYWQNIARGANKTLTAAAIEQIVDADNRSWMHFDQVMWDWIGEVRAAGKRVAKLSNMPRDLGETLATRTDRLRVFDHVTVSYEIHSVKPEPAIYEHCLAGIGTAPERTIFFDDRIANVQGAEALGIRAVEFLNRDDVLRRMRS
jgi:putative hydrolase of the HAD superfamily